MDNFLSNRTLTPDTEWILLSSLVIFKNYEYYYKLWYGGTALAVFNDHKFTIGSRTQCTRQKERKVRQSQNTNTHFNINNICKYLHFKNLITFEYQNNQ